MRRIESSLGVRPRPPSKTLTGVPSARIAGSISAAGGMGAWFCLDIIKTAKTANPNSNCNTDALKSHTIAAACVRWKRATIQPIAAAAMHANNVADSGGPARNTGQNE